MQQCKCAVGVVLRSTIAGVLLLLAGNESGKARDHSPLDWSTERYGSGASNEVHLCIPKSDAGLPRSAIVLFHGGGWTGGHVESMYDRCLTFAEQGIIGVVVQYRLAKPDDPESRWPAQLHDARAAFHWLQTNAQRINLDPRRICAYGESAGGHIALWLAMSEPALACAINAFGPTDFTKLDNRFTNAMNALVGDSKDAERLHAASPIFNIHAKMPPILAIHGQLDTLVSRSQTTAFVEEMGARGQWIYEILYPGGHQFEGISPKEVSKILSHVALFVKQARSQ